MRGRRYDYGDGYGYSNRYFEKLINYPYDEDTYKKRRGGSHYHEFFGETSPTKEHVHEYEEKTTKTVGSGDKHIHYFKITTNVEGGHTHKIIGKTGPAIETEDGGHAHYYEGITSLDYGHLHFFEGYTSPEIYKSKRRF